MSTRQNEPLLVSEAARMLGVAASTIRAMARRGELNPSFTPNGTRVFSVKDIRRVKTLRNGEKPKRS
jgi:DNA-binding transcriptional MerR regulator